MQKQEVSTGKFLLGRDSDGTLLGGGRHRHRDRSTQYLRPRRQRVRHIMAATVDELRRSQRREEEEEQPAGFEQLMMEMPTEAVKVSRNLTATFRMDDTTAARAEALDLL